MIEYFLASRAMLCNLAVLLDRHQLGRQFHLLQNFRRLVGVVQPTAATGAGLVAILDDFIDGFGRQRRAQMAGMSGLSALFRRGGRPALLSRLAGGRTISLDGGFEEFPECLRALASSASIRASRDSKSAIRRSRSAH